MEGKKGIRRSFPDAIGRFVRTICGASLASFFVLAIANEPVLAEEKEEVPLLYADAGGPEVGPRYSFKVFEDGRVEYEGYGYVRTRGKVTYRVSIPTVKRVAKILRESDLAKPSVRNRIATLSNSGLFFFSTLVIETHIRNEAIRVTSGWVAPFGKGDTKLAQGARDFDQQVAFITPMMKEIEEELGVMELRCPVPDEPPTKYGCSSSGVNSGANRVRAN